MTGQDFAEGVACLALAAAAVTLGLMLWTHDVWPRR